MSAVKSIRVGVFFFKKKTSFHLPSKKFSKIGPFTASFFIPVFLKVVSKKIANDWNRTVGRPLVLDMTILPT